MRADSKLKKLGYLLLLSNSGLAVADVTIDAAPVKFLAPSSSVIDYAPVQLLDNPGNISLTNTTTDSSDSSGQINPTDPIIAVDPAIITPTPLISWVSAVNDNGQAIGGYSLDGGNTYSNFYSASGVYDANAQTINDPNLDGGDSSANTVLSGLNDSGLVVGYHDVTNTALSQYSFIYDTNTQTYTEITPANITSGSVEAQGIDNAGDVYGLYQATPDAAPEGFFYSSAGVWTDIADPNAGINGSFITGIDASGNVDGYYIDANGVLYDFVYNPVTNAYTDTAVSLPVIQPVYLLADNTSLISAQPTIVYSASTFSAAHAVPLPASFWLMSSMLAGFGMWRRQRA